MNRRLESNGELIDGSAHSKGWIIQPEVDECKRQRPVEWAEQEEEEEEEEASAPDWMDEGRW